jgi:hypothetical protein
MVMKALSRAEESMRKGEIDGRMLTKWELMERQHLTGQT